MNLIIDSRLSEPPSEISCFRDVTLYAKTYIFEDILLYCPEGTRKMYWSWLKNYGAHDFISDLILNHEIEHGCKMGIGDYNNIVVKSINCNNLYEIIERIKYFKR
jgi:hypothetical protein